MFFGSNSISPVFPFSDLGLLKNIAFFLYRQSHPAMGYFFILSAILLCFLILAGIRLRFIPELLLWLIVINIHNRVYATITGGDNLLNQLLLFCVFLDDKQERENKPIVIALHNLAVVAILIQLCFVYGFSAYTKFNDPDWLRGTAVLSITRVHHYSLTSLEDLSYKLPFFFVFLNYLVMIYQGLFPLLIWFNKIKKAFLLIGIGMHLYIIFGMGLVSFGMIMIICYSILWPDSDKSEFYC